MRAIRRVAVVIVVGGALAAAASSLVSCGGSDPVCGDGTVDPGEQCDDGNADEADNCRVCMAYIAPRTVVKWEFNGMAAPGFSNDGCIDVGASNVQVDLAGPLPSNAKIGCSVRQVVYADLPAGMYTASVTPLDDADGSLVTTAPSVTFAANTTPNTTEEHIVVVPPEAWARPMTGTFFFILRWAGMPCAAAAPPVTTQVVTLTLAGGGTPPMANVSSVQYPSYRLDGTQPVGCVPSTLSLAEAARAAPFGRAQLTVSGRDSGGTEWFRGTFDTFIGAGVSNPVLTFDVPSTVDAAIDAPPADAAVDAGVDAAVDASPEPWSPCGGPRPP